MSLMPIYYQGNANRERYVDISGRNFYLVGGQEPTEPPSTLHYALGESIAKMISRELDLDSWPGTKWQGLRNAGVCYDILVSWMEQFPDLSVEEVISALLSELAGGLVER